MHRLTAYATGVNLFNEKLQFRVRVYYMSRPALDNSVDLLTEIKAELLNR